MGEATHHYTQYPRPPGLGVDKSTVGRLGVLCCEAAGSVIIPAGASEPTRQCPRLSVKDAAAETHSADAASFDGSGSNEYNRAS